MAYLLARQIRELPSLPLVVHRLVQTLDDPSSSAMDVENILALDQSATARLLAVANSAYYGMHHAVTTVSRAVVVLGLDEVRAIAMGTALSTLLQSTGFASQEAAQRLWLHALAVQEACLAVARSAGMARIDLAATAGLLHDLGWLVILSMEPDKWVHVEDAVQGRGMTIGEAEDMAGVSHLQAGKALASHWDMPPALAEVMGHHHSPLPDSPHRGLCLTVQLADHLACGLGFGPLPGEEPPGPVTREMSRLAHAIGGMDALMRRANSGIERKRKLWGELGLTKAPGNRVG